MGSVLRARCECGYEKDATVGSNMSMQDTYFPAYCQSCHDIVDALLHRTDKTKCNCRQCHGTKVIFYSEDCLIGERGEKMRGGSWQPWTNSWALQITDGTYYCPKCGQDRLRFFLKSLFD